MSVFAVICEYNPFHNGHKYLIEQVKRNSDTVISVMSGSFTQRGDIAVQDKYSRAKTAVINGADIVIELPAVYACANAETFAKGAVRIINSLGVVDKLFFGAENDDIKLLKLAAESFDDREFKTELKRNMDRGDYYPKAVSKAMSRVYSPAVSEVIEQPNNILAVEYIKALKKTGIEAVAIKRIGAAHDSTDIRGNITSAANIRELISSGKDYSAFVPGYLIENYADIKRIERVILYKLRTMSREDIKMLPDVNEGLENRIYEAVKNSTSLNTLYENIKTKRYTMARIRRIIISALLGISADIQKQNPSYVRVLAFNEKGAELMSDIKKRCSLPLITNVADAYSSLNDNAKKTFDIDVFATDIQSLAFENIGACSSDFIKGIVKIKPPVE